MRNSGPFYLAIIEVWYKKQRMGVHKIDSFMKNMALEAELDVEGRKLTNHSVRKTLVKKLKASNQPRSAIIGVTGHTSERSLADYEEGDEAEQGQISFIFSCPVCQQVQISRSVLYSLLVQLNHTATPNLRSKRSRTSRTWAARRSFSNSGRAKNGKEQKGGRRGVGEGSERNACPQTPRF